MLKQFIIYLFKIYHTQHIIQYIQQQIRMWNCWEYAGLTIEK